MNLKIDGANLHNLKNISIEIPHNKLVCITGVSGSGKSTIVSDIIEKESKERFFSSFSNYSRQYLDKTDRIEADISGVRAVVSVKQSKLNSDYRSTAGTISGVTDLLRLLFARCGKSSQTDMKGSRSYFSFNHPLGKCPNCHGHGEVKYIDKDLLIANPEKSLRDRAFKDHTKGWVYCLLASYH